MTGFLTVVIDVTKLKQIFLNFDPGWLSCVVKKWNCCSISCMVDWLIGMINWGEASDEKRRRGVEGLGKRFRIELRSEEK